MQTSHDLFSEHARSQGARILAVLLLLAGLAGTYQFAWRSYGTYGILRSAYEVGLPSTSSLRAWMTPEFIADTYGISVERLIAGIGVPAGTSADTPLFKIAEARQQPRIELVRRAQKVIAEEGAISSEDGVVSVENGAGSEATTEETALSAMLAYSYPALGLILLFGAIGAPVPTGFATVLAGALAADGTMDWPLAASVAIIASVGGDIVGYGVGRFAGNNFVDHYGRYFGYSGNNKVRIETLFARWGGVTVFLTRTLVSHLSSVASVLAGISRYAFLGFMIFAVAGRILWTAAYFGAGYYVGTDIEASSSFLGNVTGLAISLSVAAISAYYLVRGRRGAAATEAGL